MAEGRRIRCQLLTNFEQHGDDYPTYDANWSTDWQIVPDDATNMEIKADAKAPEIKMGTKCHVLVVDSLSSLWAAQFQIPSRWGTRSTERDIAVYVRPHRPPVRDLHLITVRIARNDSDDTVRLVCAFWHTSPAFIAKYWN